MTPVELIIGLSITLASGLAGWSLVRWLRYLNR